MVQMVPLRILISRSRIQYHEQNPKEWKEGPSPYDFSQYYASIAISYEDLHVQ